MDKVVNAGALFIKNLLHLNVVAVKKDEEEEFVLPSPYAQDYENQLARDLLISEDENTVLFLKDSFLSCYCLIYLARSVLLVGPYREYTMTRAEASRRLPKERFDDSVLECYLKWYNAQPMPEETVVKLAAHTLIVSVYGSTKELCEKNVDIQQYARTYRLMPRDLPKERTAKEMETFNELSFQYMTQIKQGNYGGAVAAYDKIMSYTNQRKSFAIIDTVEGLSNLRTLTRIASQEAGVPITTIQVVLENFKEKGRILHSKNEAIKLAHKMISEICSQVRLHRGKGYSIGVNLAIDYIHRNLACSLSVPDIANEVGLSPNRLSTKFHSEVGRTIMRYILEQRMEVAADLLVYTNLSIQDICTQIGILDSNYFSRGFKNLYGQPPTQYRKQRNTTER